MMKIDKILKTASKRIDVDPSDLQDFFAQGEQLTYEAEEWLFHESTPRKWAGLVLDGEVEIVRGLHGSTKHLAVLAPGALISESAFLDEVPHGTGAFTRLGATIWQISRNGIEAFREKKPDVFYRIIARVAANISNRLRMASERFADISTVRRILIGDVRLEHDSLGERELPSQAYYGVQTLRAMENFAISGVFVKNFEHMIEALAFVKKAAALANQELGALDKEKMKAICDACDELLAGKLHEHFTGGHVSGRSRHLHQHERQRGYRQPGPGNHGP